MTNTTTQPNKLMDDMHTRLYRVCNLITLLKEVDATADDFNSGHEEVVQIIDDTLCGVFDSLDDISKALNLEQEGKQSC